MLLWWGGEQTTRKQDTACLLPQFFRQPIVIVSPQKICSGLDFNFTLFEGITLEYTMIPFPIDPFLFKFHRPTTMRTIHITKPFLSLTCYEPLQGVYV